MGCGGIGVGVARGSAMHKLEIISTGESAGVILPEEVMARLGARKGDTLCLTEAAGGGYRLTMWSAAFERQMGVVEEIMEEGREVLRGMGEAHGIGSASHAPAVLYSPQRQGLDQCRRR